MTHNPSNTSSGTGSNHVLLPCGCTDEHEPFCDVGRFEQEKKVRQLLRALRTIARGEVSGYELQQIAIRTLTDYNEVKT